MKTSRTALALASAASVLLAFGATAGAQDSSGVDPSAAPAPAPAASPAPAPAASPAPAPAASPAPAPAASPAPAPAPAPAASPAPKPEDPRFAEAKQRFLQGVALAKAGNCEGAISELRASYQVVPRSNTLFNIAHCHEELFQYTLAIEAYEKFLETAKKEDPDYQRVVATITSLRVLLGTLVIASNVPAQVWLGDRKIGEAPGKVLIPGGRHVVELRADGYLASRQEIEIAGRKSLDLNFTLIVAQKKVTITKIESRGLAPNYFFGGASATGVVLLGGAYFGWRAKLADTSAQSIDPRLPREQEKSDIKTLSNVADVLFLTAGVFAVGTTVVYFLTDWKPGKTMGHEKNSQSLTLLPQVRANSWGLSLRGRL